MHRYHAHRRLHDALFMENARYYISNRFMKNSSMAKGEELDKVCLTEYDMAHVLKCVSRDGVNTCLSSRTQDLKIIPHKPCSSRDVYAVKLLLSVAVRCQAARFR